MIFVLMMRFLVVMGIVVAGFIFGMQLVHGAADPVDGYDTIGRTLMTLFAAARRLFLDFGVTDDRTPQHNAVLMMGVFIAAISLLCLNLLIAFLTDAYTQVVRPRTGLRVDTPLPSSRRASVSVGRSAAAVEPAAGAGVVTADPCPQRASEDRPTRLHAPGAAAGMVVHIVTLVLASPILIHHAAPRSERVLQRAGGPDDC